MADNLPRQDHDTVLIYAINRTDRWWKHVGGHLGFDHHVVVTDIRGTGDRDVIDDFYSHYRSQIARQQVAFDHFSPDEVMDIVSRCRLLRWLPLHQAQCMVAAMEYAFGRVLDEVQPCVITSFPIDRYVSDVLERLALRRGIPYFELTASLISGMCMLMYRGQLVTGGTMPTTQEVQEQVRTIANPSFTPAYVQQDASRFTPAKWRKTFLYFRVRGYGFKLISWLKRDPFNLHYLDAQAFLGHKPRRSDLRVLDLIDWQWRNRLDAFPRQRRIFFGLQLFPEASIDYWLGNSRLIDYEEHIVAAATAFSQAGYLILVKDHPSQFGFRQCELLDRLLALPNVVMLPYEVSGNEVVSLCDTNFTMTGTLGLQSALMGLASVATPTYYVTPDDFVLFDDPAQLAGLPRRVGEFPRTESLDARRDRIVSHLLQGSFKGNYFSFREFDPRKPDPSAKALANAFGLRLKTLIAP